MRMSRRSALIALPTVALIALVARSLLAPPSVKVAMVRRGALTDALSATGVVEAAQVAVAPKVVGRIAELLVDEGDAAQNGQVLARLDNIDELAALREWKAALEAAKAEVARAEAALKQERAASRARIERAGASEEAARARLEELKAGSRPEELETARQAVAAAEADAALAAADFERINQLLAEGAVSRADADRARTRLANTEAALRAAREQLALVEEGARREQIAAAAAEVAASRAQLAEARAAAGQVEVLEKVLAGTRATAEQAEARLAAARNALAETEVVAPISGRVGRRYLDVGDLTGPGAPIFLIADNENLWIAAEVDEEDLALVYEGQQVKVTAEALADPLPGRVVKIAPVALPRGLQQVRAKIVRAKIILDETTDVLRAGMEVDVYASSVVASDALLVPSEALTEIEGDASVFVLENGRARRRRIEVGRRTFREVAVKSGLSEGDLVVISDKAKLREGGRVKPDRE